MFKKILELPVKAWAWYLAPSKSTKIETCGPPDVPKAPWVKKFADEEEERRRYTYDMPTLTRKPWHWLFIPDEMQHGWYRHHLIENQCERFQFDGFTQQKMVMLRHGDGPWVHPLIFDNDLGYQTPDPMLPVKGEIYKNVPPWLFIDLDQFRSNGIFYTRKLVSIVVPIDKIAFKDRSKLDNIVGRVSRTHKTTVAYFRNKKKFTTSYGETKTLVPAEAAELARDTQINSGVLQGHLSPVRVMQEMMYMYVANRDYWVDRLDRTNMNQPCASFVNQKGLIKEYYRFTNEEDPPF